MKEGSGRNPRKGGRNPREEGGMARKEVSKE